MKVIVTGASGFVGKKLIERLLESGDLVNAIVRDRSRCPKEWEAQVKVTEAALSDYSKILSTGEDYDCLVHLAWEGTAGKLREDTKKQTDNVLYACEAVRLAKRLGCKRFVYAGSIMEYDALKLLEENAGTNPPASFEYSTCKLAGELMTKVVAAEENIEHVTVNISNIYGEGEENLRFFGFLIKSLMENKTVELTACTQAYDFIYINDAVRMIEKVIKQGKNQQSYYIGNKEPQPLKEFVETVKRVIGGTGEVLYGKKPLLGQQLSFKEFDTKKVYEEIGFECETDFESGVRKIKKFLEEK